MAFAIDKTCTPPLVLDEIALEGLDGVILQTLWIRIQEALERSTPLQDYMKKEIWQFIRKYGDGLQFYELPEERPPYKSCSRFDVLDQYLGIPIEEKECPWIRLEYVPIEDNGVCGSCAFYKERKRIPNKEMSNLSLEDVEKKWGNKLVIVASQTLRSEALTPPYLGIPDDLSIQQYCILEAIGRSRTNGETLSGSYCLLAYCPDPTILFYIKNRLVRMGLVASQTFNVIREGKNFVTSLLNLPRFYSITKSTLSNVVERMFVDLKEKPDHSMPTTEAYNYFHVANKAKAFRQTADTHLFRKHFNIVSIPFSTYHDRVRRNYPTETKEKQVKIIKLRNPEMDQEDLFADETDEPKMEDNDAFVTNDNFRWDVPLREQFYKAVLRFGERGCSLSELTNYLGISRLLVRQIIKTMLSDQLYVTYVVEDGRQRTSMYVAIELASSSRPRSSAQKLSRKTECAENPKLPTYEVTLADVPDVVSRIKVYDIDKKFTLGDRSSQRLLDRIDFVFNAIDKRCIVQFLTLHNALRDHENNVKGDAKVRVCRKSLLRILRHLCLEQKLHIYEITLKYNEHVRIYRYVTHPKIDIDHDVLQKEIINLKNKFFITLEERRLKQVASEKRERKVVPSSKKLQELKAKESQKTPKFLISRYMHEFLFYIVVELSDRQMPREITEELLQQWQTSEPDLQIAEYMAAESDKPQVYSANINWRTFIPPLPTYSEKPARWVYFPEAVDRMPLSIFNKIFRIEKNADERLTAYLKHPVRQHYLMRQLPLELQCLMSRYHLQRVYTVVLKLLNNMGLVQVSDRFVAKDPLNLWVYLNRYARIMDTTPSEASFSAINPERQYDSLYFDLTSMQDVHQYWANLQRICIYTKLGFPLKKRSNRDKSADNDEGEQSSMAASRIRKERRLELQYLPSVDYDEAPQKDTGEIPGDRLGAAGLSTQLFAHTFRNWSWLSQSASAPKNIRSGRSKMSRLRLYSQHGRKRAAVGQTTGGVRRLPVGVSSRSAARSRKKSMPRDAIDRDALKNMRTLRVKWNRNEDRFIKLARAVYTYIAAPMPVLEMLTVGRIVRDVLRRTLGSYNKTIQACVRRLNFLVRMNRHVPEVPTWVHLLQKHETMMSKYGDEFLTRLRKTYPLRSEFSDALVIHFINILWMLYREVHNTSDSPVDMIFQIPDSPAEFHQKFTSRAVPPASSEIEYTNPSTEFELQVAIVINVLHSSLCCVRDKTLYNLQCFDIYKSYTEEVLQAAFTKARADGLVIALKRKHIQLIPNQLAGPAYLLSSKYRMSLTFLRIPYQIYDAYYECFDRALDTFFRTSPPSSSSASSSSAAVAATTSLRSRKGSVAAAAPPPHLELKSPHAGQLLFLAEGLSSGYWRSSIKLPINILTVDAGQGQTVSPLDRMFDHYHTIFDNAPQTEYTKPIESEAAATASSTTGESRPMRVKFHPAHLSYKLVYSPYDLISKLPTRYLHFFCALDSVNRKVDINFSRLHRDQNTTVDEEHIENDKNAEAHAESSKSMECPFNCILSSGNYLNAIERIVLENRHVIGNLSETPPQKLLNDDNSGCSIDVDSSNLLTIVRMLESFWREKEAGHERRDVGKVRDGLRSSLTLDWQELCRDILEFDSSKDDDDTKIDELEPSLNKEERVVRGQDVFVVNLPTLQLMASDRLKADKDQAKSGGKCVPRVLLEGETIREKILQKITEASYWNYTKASFEDLKPQLNSLNFTDSEQLHLEELHAYIERHPLGVPVDDLLREFPFESFLKRSLETLASHGLVKRVGVASFMYVHKTHIRPWLIHTFHIKRLEREKLGQQQTQVAKATRRPAPTSISLRKRKRSEAIAEDNVNDASASKKKKSEAPEAQPVPCFMDAEETTNSKEDVQDKDVIVMRPQPWMRLNGTINRRVLDRWLGSILTECVARAGCSVESVCHRFPHMVPVDVMFLLELLADLKCLHLTQIRAGREDNLFSDYEDMVEVPVSDLYMPADTFVNVSTDALMRFAVFVGAKKYSAEFI